MPMARTSRSLYWVSITVQDQRVENAYTCRTIKIKMTKLIWRQYSLKLFAQLREKNAAHR